MKLLFLIGNTSVGKMTVGQELAKITDMRLFHNHMTIEPVIEIFGSYENAPVARMREVIFEELAKSDKYGLIFTYMWAFDDKESCDFAAHVYDIFNKYNADIYYAELVALQEIRLARNITENRLRNKPSKRNIEWSNRMLKNADEKYRIESYDGEIESENYIKTDNTNISPEEAALMIKQRFSL